MDIKAYWGIFWHIWESTYLRIPCIYKRAIFRALGYLEQASPKACRTCKMIMHVQSPGTVRTVYSSIFKDFQAYLGILMHNQPHSQGALPCLFWKSKKEYPDFGKKGSDCVHLWVKFSIQSAALRVSRRKNSKMFPCKASFSCVFVEIFIEMVNSTTIYRYIQSYSALSHIH